MEALESEVAIDFTSSTTDLPGATPSSSTAKLTEIRNTTKLSSCCTPLDKFCEMFEVEPGRMLRVCHIEGDKKIDPLASECYKETSRKSTKITNNVDIALQYNVNFAADISPELNRKSYLNLPESVKKLDEEVIKNTAIFFFHGVGGEFKVWSPQIIFFNNLGFTVVAMDFIGHGLSHAPQDSHAYHFDVMSRDAIAVFDKYTKTKNILVGHSYGSCFAAVVTRSRSNMVHSLIMISGGGPFPLGPQLGPFCLPICILNLLRPLIFRGFLNRSFERPDRLNACHVAAVGCPMHVLKSTLKGQKWDAGGIEYYSCITCRTLLIHGRRDRLIPVSDVILMKNILLQGELALIEDAGHMVMLEAPNKINSLLVDFVVKSLQFSSLTGINPRLRKKMMSAESTV